MGTKALIAYASKLGATAEIAEKIGDVLRQSGLETDILPADKATNLASYDAVIVGSAAYVGKWRKEAVAFVEENETSLAGKPVWLFSSGPTGEGYPVELGKGWRYPEALQPVIERIKPRDVAVFHGKLDPNKLGFIEKLMIKGVKAPIGDFRNWDMIAAWAASIAEELKKQG